MRKFILALLAGGLLTGIASVALAQDMASAVPAPKSEFMVFTEKGNHALSPTAIAMIRSVADDARQSRHITLSGSAANVAAVKSELIREGVPQSAIVVRSDLDKPLPRTGDGLSDPADRRVVITF